MGSQTSREGYHNLNIHKMRVVRDTITAAGGIPIYLPTYSPELNPIERLWADMKRQLRTLALNIDSELLHAIRRLRASTPIAKIAGWFRHSIAEAQKTDYGVNSGSLAIRRVTGVRRVARVPGIARVIGW
ncbi:transposase [Pendulispora rubella]|uniref:transposase n=1 Tax=Pendulispora rubella TaxID=2741070 RepID=UPI00374E0A0A